MRTSPCLRVETPQPLRVALLKDEYEHFLVATDVLSKRLVRLSPLYGKKVVERWGAMAAGGDHDALIDELLTLHYDPTYTRSIEQNFPRQPEALIAEVRDISSSGFRALARDVLARTAELQTLAA
jgi:tRNA 2-selenouridine synthase